ncbi:helix-turn-helix domain-containing protein [Streptomyces sp. NPDC056716]|uniref:helix-turn-helix domain-containing protein n=1 Tax=unclassified Streptomyces TaxID=2593676 RepID=UPI0036A5751A
MTRRRQPTARQERLGAELRKLREAAGFKAREAASLLGTDSAHMSLIESGFSGVSEVRVRQLAAHYSCTDSKLVDALAAMATDQTRGWWEEYRGKLATAFLDLSELEHHAAFRWDVDFLYIPGLLQTESYAHALFSYMNPQHAGPEIECWVQHRMRRKIIIARPNPMLYEAVIHEAALHIRVGDRAETRAQLDRVLELSEENHITVRVIPFDLDRFAGAGSAMAYAGGPVPKLDTVVRDSPDGTGFVGAEAQLNRFRMIFHKLESVSLEAKTSRDFIHRMAKKL